MRLRHHLLHFLLPILSISATAQVPAPFTTPPPEEVPFVTTPDHVTVEMLRLAGVGAADYVMDLGSGDGRIVITAARLFGARGLGVEIVPDLVEQSIRNARAAGVSDRAEFRVQDIFQTNFAPATVITMYLLPEFNLRLRPDLLKLKPGTRLVSHDWDMEDWKPDRTVVIDVPDKKVGREKLSRLHLWVVPARVDGLWCGAGLLRGTSMRFKQTFQMFEGLLVRGGRQRDFAGHIQGARVVSTTGKAADLGLEAVGEHLHIRSAPADLALLRGARFERASGAAERCPG